MIETYFVYFLEGAEVKDPVAGKDLVKKFEVIASNEIEAIEKAKKLINCNYYQVWSVSEKVK